MIIQAEIYNHRHIIGFITRRQALVFVVWYPYDKFVCKFFTLSAKILRWASPPHAPSPAVHTLLITMLLGDIKDPLSDQHNDKRPYQSP